MTTASCEIDAGSYRGYLQRMQVGTKELKNRLSHYLRLARAGQAIEVTDRGTVVAELRAARPREGDDEACLAEMESLGLVTRGRGHERDIRPARMRGPKTLSEIVLEDRR
jgi:prevent-host-death family protein